MHMMISQWKEKKAHQSGAVMAEFSLAIVVFLVVMGITIDLGLTYFRYNLLVFGTQKIMRRHAVDLRGNLNAIALNGFVTSELQNFMQGVGANPADFAIDNVGIVVEGCGTTELRCYLHATGARWQSFSFANLLWQQSFDVQTESRVLIEDPCFICNDSLCGP